MEINLGSLPPGSKFYMRLDTTGRRVHGTILHVGLGSVFVEWEPVSREIKAHDKTTGEEKVVMVSSRKRENISLQTLVVVEEK